MTTYLFRVWAGGDGSVSDLAQCCQDAGLHVVIHGSEHVYVLRDSPTGPDGAEHAVRFLLDGTTWPSTVSPVLWATLTEEAATHLREAHSLY